MQREMKIVISWYLKAEVNLQLLISRSKFSGPRKFTLRYQKLEITGAEMQREIKIVISWYLKAEVNL